jgi:hypothetical protein
MRVQWLGSFITALLLLVLCNGVQVAWGDIFGRISGTAKESASLR